MNLRDKVMRQTTRQPAIFAILTIVIIIIFFVLNSLTIKRENEIKSKSAKTNYSELASQAGAVAE